ncbi:MAG: SPOR domain-containing protein, partial [Rhodocyclaceae bacterium]|nr:SPOR domain-containing protein [Rhodocyclaceae bacterium]
KPQPEEARIASTKGGFLVQLGVFGVSGNAEALFAELKKQGVPARLETRVVAGPFPNRKSAEAARERLARAGLAKGIVVQSR